VVDVDFGGNLSATVACVRAGGSVAVYASNGDRAPRLPVRELMARNISVHLVVLPTSPARGAPPRAGGHRALDWQRAAHADRGGAVPAVRDGDGAQGGGGGRQGRHGGGRAAAL